MDIQLNGDTYTVEKPVTLQGLVEQLQLTHKRIAVEVNQSIVPRHQYASYQLQANDRVEIVQAIGGG